MSDEKKDTTQTTGNQTPGEKPPETKEPAKPVEPSVGMEVDYHMVRSGGAVETVPARVVKLYKGDAARVDLRFEHKGESAGMRTANEVRRGRDKRDAPCWSAQK